MVDIIWLLTMLLLIVSIGLMLQAIRRMKELESKVAHIEGHVDEMVRQLPKKQRV